jgi:hypothetical protein
MENVWHNLFEGYKISRQRQTQSNLGAQSRAPTTSLFWRLVLGRQIAEETKN